MFILPSTLFVSEEYISPTMIFPLCRPSLISHIFESVSIATFVISGIGIHKSSPWCPNAVLKITLFKNIPAGSGLGGASSDAAAVLLGVNRLLKLGCSDEELGLLAAELGSDVTFFLDGPLSFCSGQGEMVEKIEEIFNFLAVLMLPDVNVSTKMVYESDKIKFAYHFLDDGVLQKDILNLDKINSFPFNFEFVLTNEKIREILKYCTLMNSIATNA